MVSYLLLCGPNHAEIVEAPEGEPVYRPAPPNFDDSRAGRLESADPNAMIAYRPWSLGDRIGARFNVFSLMVAETHSDFEAIKALRQMVQGYLDRPGRVVDERQRKSVSEMLAALDDGLERLR